MRTGITIALVQSTGQLTVKNWRRCRHATTVVNRLGLVQQLRPVMFLHWPSYSADIQQCRTVKISGVARLWGALVQQLLGGPPLHFPLSPLPLPTQPLQCRHSTMSHRQHTCQCCTLIYFTFIIKYAHNVVMKIHYFMQDDHLHICTVSQMITYLPTLCLRRSLTYLHCVSEKNKPLIFAMT